MKVSVCAGRQCSPYAKKGRPRRRKAGRSPPYRTPAAAKAKADGADAAESLPFSFPGILAVLTQRSLFFGALFLFPVDIARSVLYNKAKQMPDKGSSTESEGNHTHDDNQERFIDNMQISGISRPLMPVRPACGCFSVPVRRSRVGPCPVLRYGQPACDGSPSDGIAGR